MPKLNCPHCNKVSEFIDTGVGWKCSDCPGHVFTQYKDKDGVLHRYSDPDIQRQRMLEQSHIYDMDAMDTMVGVTEPGPFFSLTMESLTPAFQKLGELADELDLKGFKKEADKIDEFLFVNKVKGEPNETRVEEKPIKILPPNEMHEKPDLKFIPYDDIYSLSGEPLSNL